MSSQYAILGLLKLNSMTGYDLKKMFDKSINYFWAVHLSQIYRDLGILEKKAYVTSVIQQQEDRPNKRIYSITEIGVGAFDKWINSFPKKLSKETRDEFILRIFFGAEIEESELIKQLERYVVQKQNQKKTIIADIGKDIVKYSKELKTEKEMLYWRFIEKKAQMTNEVLIQWAEECIQDLKRKS